jgi:TonB family protein
LPLQRQGWCPISTTEVYSPREIALAAGVPEEAVLAALGGSGYVRHADAVRIGRQLVATLSMAPVGPTAPLFAHISTQAIAKPSRSIPLVLSSTLHAGFLAVAIFIATFGLTPTAATLNNDDHQIEPMRLVFIATPGPGGGGGGGGLRQRAPAPKALREGRHAISSPIPVREPPKPIVPTPAPPEPKPEPLKAEHLPTVVAPIITAPADTRSRIGVFDETPAATDSHGPGAGGGAGTGTGTGLGAGDGSGIGPGSGGGTGGGPYRPGSGIEPPKLLREVKADYTEDARQRGIEGDVVLEIVVRRDGSVADVRILQGLSGGLNDRAVQAVRQWRFSPARRQGSPVDVVVEVAVQFKLR